MHCPNIFTVDWWKEFVEYLGGDPSATRNKWDWQEKAEKFFENAKTGDPSFGAFCLVDDC